MKFLNHLTALYGYINSLFFKQTGFNIHETSFDKIVNYFYAPIDSSSLAVSRILFGMAMLFDIPDERGGSTIMERWGDPKICHFPLIPFIEAVPMPYMALVYIFLWLGALGIMLGYKFRLSATIFAVFYWYLILIEKSFWNNHSYLFGLISILIIGTGANNYLSMDAYLQASIKKDTVPYWNYFVLKYQFFILYFMAGLKKSSAEWLTGYSLVNLSEHWVFDPFKLFLTVSETDFLIVHWFAFIFDLTVAFWMMWRPTRHLAMIFCAAFHIMNIRLFRIGMFPWVCLATMPLFYPFSWPKTIYKNCMIYLNSYYTMSKKFIYAKTSVNNINVADAKEDEIGNENSNGFNNNEITTSDIDSDANEKNNQEINDKKSDCSRRATICLIFFYMFLQAFLPYSHFITKGYNNWTNGLYGYSWDMMVHTWDTVSVIVKVVDNDRNQEIFLEPNAYALNNRWTRHGDMVKQYANCLKKNLISDHGMDETNLNKDTRDGLLRNISIYIEVWCSMNERFQQRMFNSKVDILKAKWTPFEDVSWLMPLLVDADHWRNTLSEIRQDVYSWNNFSDVLFVADFPGYILENYISEDHSNVTLSVLEGRIAYEPEESSISLGNTYIMEFGDHLPISSGKYHKIHTLGNKPAYFMYTFNVIFESGPKKPRTKLPLIKEVYIRLQNMTIFFNFVIKSLYQLVFGCQC